MQTYIFQSSITSIINETIYVYKFMLALKRPLPPILQVLLYPGALAGSAGQRFEALVERGGPLGELVQWADLSASLTLLGHNLTFSTSQQQLHRSAPLSYTNTLTKNTM